ncbi:MAG TPA: condensation domain-containing protein, partial [Steroidobacteraceae bacterium]|nr:condensation domain-containing protein [Steroidobacteraceae bacterium]
MADPFGAPGGRLYRTGDVGRWRADGVVEFLGRSDGQVKLRGLRIEPGEIEAALLEHGGIASAAVVVWRDRLVAYAVARGAAPSASALRAHLGARLPAHMLPQGYVFLSGLPRTSSGKLDRRALPEPAWREADGYQAPQGAVEELLAGIWSELLGVERVGRQDSFFDLGGHSLLATRLVSRVRAVLGVELALRSVFEQPSLAALAEAVSGAQATAGAAVAAGPRPAWVPLSFAQQRLWFLEQLEGGSSYTVPMALRLSGALEVGALRQALSAVVARHEALRTTFPVVEGVAVQSVEPASRFALVEEDVAAAELAGRLAALSRRRFDLARDLPVAAHLLRLGAEDHVLAVVVHHIAFDGWSASILLRELEALYGAALEDGAAGLAALSVQYADYALWQRRHHSAVGDLAYWRSALAGAPEALELPTDRARGAGRGPAGVVEARLDGSLVGSLRALCRREGVTLFMVLQAALSVVLSRWSGQDDILLGTPVANRTRHEVEGLIGFFVNTLVLRTRVAGDASVGSLLSQVRETALGAYAHQALPFEQLVEELQPVRSLERSPLFQVMLVLQNQAQASPALAGVRAETLALAPETAKFELTLSLAETGDGLAASLEYDAALYGQATAARLLAHLERALGFMASGGSARLRDLSLLSAAERASIVEGWNASSAWVPDATLMELFAAQAAQTPDAVAVTCGGVGVSYGDLAARARRLARRLIGLGVGAETVVGVALERSADLVVGLLAVLEAGGCYLPLDAGHPPARLAFLLADAGAALVLSAGAAALPAGLPVLRLDAAEAQARLAALSPAPLAARERTAAPHPDHLAYIIYTSGSTGSPKGVAVSQRAIVNHTLWLNRRFGLGPGDRVLQKTALGFDASVWEFLSTLT